MTRIEAVIIRRGKDENTVALVSAECDPEMIDGTNDLFGGISRAVSRWAQTGGSKRLSGHDRGDINIGDLADQQPFDANLKKELTKEGIYDLKISGVTARPLRRQGEESLTGDEFALRV
jgi:hypothetical protein